MHQATSASFHRRTIPMLFYLQQPRTRTSTSTFDYDTLDSAPYSSYTEDQSAFSQSSLIGRIIIMKRELAPASNLSTKEVEHDITRHSNSAHDADRANRLHSEPVSNYILTIHRRGVTHPRHA